MNLYQLLLLAILQGVTEFLPVSSSGHLVIAQTLLGLTQPPVAFDVLVHLGTLLAVIFYFRTELLKLIKNLWIKDEGAIKTAWLLLVGTVPAAIAGGFLWPYLGQIFASLSLVGMSLIVTGLLLFSLKLSRPGKREITDLKWRDALIIGLFQALALLPGVSRAGATIVAASWLGARPKSAFTFSFFLAIPATLGAFALQAPQLAVSGNLIYYLLALFVAGLVGLAALKVVEKALVSARISLFGFYCLAVGALLLLT